MNPVDELCEACSDPILKGDGRYRDPVTRKAYHTDCKEDFKVNLGIPTEMIAGSATSMLFDKRITA